MQEKRKFGRIPFGTSVTINIQNHSYSGKLQDLSLNGALVGLSAPALATGTPCQLRLPLSTDLTLEFAGTIAHAHADAVGIHFTQSDPESFGHLIRLMELNTGDAEKIHHELHDIE